MEFNAYSMLVDFMWAGIFLFVAKMLREKIKILQSLFVPVSLLAGFIGLALGQNGFGIISFSSHFVFLQHIYLNAWFLFCDIDVL